MATSIKTPLCYIKNHQDGFNAITQLSARAGVESESESGKRLDVISGGEGGIRPPPKLHPSHPPSFPTQPQLSPQINPTGCTRSLPITSDEFATNLGQFQDNRVAPQLESTLEFSQRPQRQEPIPAGILPCAGTALKAVPRLFLNAILYGRYSSTGQTPTSSGDQINQLRDWTTKNLEGPFRFHELKDDAVPGARASREGLDEVRELITTLDPGVILVESMARLFRSSRHAIAFLEDAVDLGWRFISIKDGLDTKHPLWKPLSVMLALFAELDNSIKSETIKRGHKAAFDRGYSTGAISAGYKRISALPVDPNVPYSGPTLEIKDTNATPWIEAMYRRVVAMDSLADIALWANEQKLPKGDWATNPEWTYADVARLIRNPRNKGWIRLRNRVSKLIAKTGYRIQVPNTPDGVLWRYDAEQAHVSVQLWDAAFNVLEDRAAAFSVLGGARRGAKPHQERPSNEFPNRRLYCGICGSRYWRSSKDNGQFFCSKARKGTCPNRAMVGFEVLREAIFKVVAEKLVQLKGLVPELAELMQQCVRDLSSESPKKLSALRLSITRIEGEESRLTSALRAGGNMPSLVAALKDLDKEKEEVNGALARLETIADKLDTTQSSASFVHERIASLEKALSEKGCCAPLSQLIPRIVLIPIQVQGFKTPKLRAKFALTLIDFLPEQWSDYMKFQKLAPGENLNKLHHDIQIDLFQPSKHHLIATEVFALRSKGVRASDVRKSLNLSKTTMNRAYKFGAAMAQNGTPYTTELSQSSLPRNLGRWQRGKSRAKKNAS